MAQDQDLVDMLEAFRHNLVNELHTMMPGKVLKYYPSTQLADIQPMVKKFYWKNVVTNDELHIQKAYVSYPAIPGVPVIFPGGNNFTITWPINAGDNVCLFFSEAALTEFLTSDQESEPVEITRHKLGHCFAQPVKVPAPFASTDPATVDNAAMMLGAPNGTQIRINAAGNAITIDASVILLGAGATEFVALADKVDNAVNTLVTATHTALAAITPTSGGTAAATGFQTATASIPSSAATVTKAA